MPEKILGLDIGKSSIKAVRVMAGLRGYEVADTALVNINKEGGAEEALKKLFKSGIFTDSVCITALPAMDFFFRNIRLPFKDKKKISQTIAYELEPLIPCLADEVLIDYVITDQTDQTNIFSAAVHKSTVGDLTTRLKECRVEASLIDIDAVPAVSRLLTSHTVTECGLFLDIGARDTTGVIFGKSGIIHIRRFSFGGEKITKAIAKALKIEFSEAEKKKRTGHTDEAVEEISAMCKKFFSEVKNTLQFLGLKGNLKKAPTKIFLTGGGALYPPLQKKMETFFSIPVEMVDISAADDITMEKEVKNGWNPMLMNQALALATRETKKGAGFNFARGEFGSKSKYEKFQKDFKWAAVIIFIILCAFGVDVYIDYHYDRAHLNRLKQEITSVFKKTCPEVTRIVDPVQQLKVKIAEAGNSSSGLNGAGSGIRTLDIIKDISRLIPESTDFLITSFTFDGAGVKIKGETDNFNTVDNIKNSLSKSNYFKNVTISSASLIKKGSRVGMDLRIEVGR
ncbi:MAG: pilus assembly protein PilM [Thermodesulfobacteriota bacterium]|nr:pilus assembly protein PilM [Thermodesulfobacteriota bacterium]